MSAAAAIIRRQTSCDTFSWYCPRVCTEATSHPPTLNLPKALFCPICHQYGVFRSCANIGAARVHFQLAIAWIVFEWCHDPCVVRTLRQLWGRACMGRQIDEPMRRKQSCIFSWLNNASDCPCAEHGEERMSPKNQLYTALKYHGDHKAYQNIKIRTYCRILYYTVR